MTDDNVDADSELGFEPAVSDNAIRPSSVSRSRTRSPLRRKLTGIAVLIGALTTVGGGYALLAPASGAADTSNSSADIEAGRQLFNVSCITCHGANLQGVQGRGPTLVGVGSAATYFQVSTGRMPAVTQGPNNLRKDPKFTEEQTRQLAAFIQSVGGGPEVPAAGTNLRTDDSKLAQGGQLFRLNCASCHGATGKGAPLSAGKIAPGLTVATDTQIYTAMLSGPENMPVFSNNQITPEQKQEIISYIQYLRNSKDPGGAGLDRIGPVSEGLLIWTAGLGVLMITILWIGAKS
ncbi:MAG: cytochrome c [Actinomycetota bacterium]|nr:cytochrome c [Actinomycetota bacterium]MDQ2958236.1 cytochrome c [Actinomycetota bacterium]